MNFLPCLQTVQYSKFATPKTNYIVTTCCSGIINYRQNIRSLQHQKLTFYTNSVVPTCCSGITNFLKKKIMYRRVSLCPLKEMHNCLKRREHDQ